MSGADAYFLWEESFARHMHTLKIVVVDPSGAHEKVNFERVRRGALRVLPYLPAFRRRVVDVPLFFGHPYWADAPAFNADYHLRHEVLPPDAGEEELDALVGRIASEPLDRSRPLWQIYFVEGLPRGRVAYLTKLHHAVADGTASAEIVLRSFQQDSQPAALPAAYEGSDELLPPVRRRVLAAWRREFQRQLGLPALLGRSLRSLAILIRWRLAGRHAPVQAFSTPGTRFNRAPTPNRIYTHARLSLPRLQQVSRAFGCTLNDVYLAVVGGALRANLESHGERTTPSLTAAVPASVRGERDDPVFGNAVAYWFASIGSDVADPFERLRAVAESTRAARTLFEARDPRLPVDWFEHWTLRRLYLSGLPSFLGALLGRPSYNVIVSNVRGPSRPLFSDGARVEALYSMGPLSPHQGLNFTAWSYLDDLTVGIHACREHMPDLRSLAESLPRELEKLSLATKP